MRESQTEPTVPHLLAQSCIRVGAKSKLIQKSIGRGALKLSGRSHASRGRLSLEDSDVAVSESEMKVTLKRKDGMPLSNIPELDVPDISLPGAGGELAEFFTSAPHPSG
jgi:hypothetical protein